MAEEKRRVFLFYGSGGKTVFLSTSISFEDLVERCKSEFTISTKEQIHFVTESGKVISSCTDLFQERDPLVYIYVGVIPQSAFQKVTSPEDMMERKKRERMEAQKQKQLERQQRQQSTTNTHLDQEQERQERERQERERQERERQEREHREQQRRDQERQEQERREQERQEQERQERERQERERQEWVRQERLERERLERQALEQRRQERERPGRGTTSGRGQRIDRKSEIPPPPNEPNITDMDALQQKIDLLEGFGTRKIHEKRKIRIFVIRLNGIGKPITITQNSPEYTWEDFVRQVRDLIGFKPDEYLCFNSEKNGRIGYDLNRFEEDDLVVVTNNQESDEQIQNYLQKLRKMDSLNEKERVRRETEMKEKLSQAEAREIQMENIPEEKRAQLMKLKEAENKTFECPICFDDVLMRNTYTFDDCFHRFCRECAGNYIKEQINQGGILSKGSAIGIKCPATRCAQILAIHEIKNIVDKQTFDHYDLVLRDKAIEILQDIIWCPSPDCGNALIREFTTPMLVCYHCQYTWCSKCDVPWHFDITCVEYKRWMTKSDNAKKDQDAYELWLKSKTKPCPQCKVAIEKNGGCNHMTCGKCHYEFCWLCLQKYFGGHFNRSGCRQFT